MVSTDPAERPDAPEGDAEAEESHIRTDADGESSRIPVEPPPSDPPPIRHPAVDGPEPAIGVDGEEPLIAMDEPLDADGAPAHAPTDASSSTEDRPEDAIEPSAPIDDEESPRAFWKELPALIIVALFVAVLIKTFLVQAFFIPSGSMRETLEVGDRVMVNKLAYRFGEPSQGDVIVFDSPLVSHDDDENLLGAVVRNIGEALGLSTPDSALIKRVVAVGGETVEIAGNRVLIDGVALDEPYLTRSISMGDFGPLEVPEDQVFVMGDNRNQSEDSRVFGPIPTSTIIGRAFVKVWPPSRWGGL